MMRTIRNVAIVTLAMMIAAPAMAQDEKKKGKRARAEKREGAKRQTAQVPLQFLENIKLTEAQEVKLAAIKKELGPKFAEVRKRTRAILTPEQQKARTQAMKAAKGAGKKRKETMAAVEKAMKLTDAQKKGMAEAKKLTAALQQQLRAKVETILTDEQKAALPKRDRKGRAGGEKRAKNKKKK